jgi:hypothetical protein
LVLDWPILGENKVFAAELCCPQRIKCSLPNYVFRSESGVRYRTCVVRSESGVRCQIMYSTANQVFAAEFVLSVANQVFSAELCCPQRIKCSLPNLCCPQWIRSGVHCQIVLSAANQVFAAELCIPQWIRCSLLNLCCPQWIRFSLSNYVVRSESGFAVEVVLSAANLQSLLKSCCLQQKCDSLPKSSCLQRIRIRCQKRVGCSEVAFAAEIMVPATKQFRCQIVRPAANQFSLPKCAACSELVFATELYDLQRISFCYWIVWPAANQFRCRFSSIDRGGRNDLNACNNFIVWWCKMRNTWMWTYGLLK